MEEVNFCVEAAQEQMEKSVAFTEVEFSKVRAGKANPAIVSSVMVDYYGSPTPLPQVASVNTLDARTLLIKPWEKTMLQPIETAIINSDLGINPQNDGDVIRINIPALTEERRKDLVKIVRAISENGKVAIRSARKEANNELKGLQKDGAPEDLIKKTEDDIQKLTDKFSKDIDELLMTKEKEIMTV